MSSLPFAEIDLERAIARHPLTISHTAQVTEAIALMSAGGTTCSLTCDLESDHHLLRAEASCVLVVEGNQLVGIVTERDVVRLRAAGHDLKDGAIADIMTHPVLTLQASEFTDLFAPLHLFQRHHIRHLPVIDPQGQIVGLLTHESLQQLLRPVDLLRLRLAAEVMPSEVIHAPPTASILELTQQMAAHRVSSIVIVEERIQESHATDYESSRLNSDVQFYVPVGIVTERDVVQFLALGLDIEQVQAQTVMSTPVFSVRPDATLWAVRMVMQAQRISRVVVTSQHNRLLGIVTQSSLLNALNPLEIYNMVAVLEQKVSRLEAEKFELLQIRTTALEQQVQDRTAELKAQAERERLLTKISTHIRASLNLQAILDTAVMEVRSLLGCDRVIVYQFQPDWSGTVVAEAITDQEMALLGQKIHDPSFSPDWVKPYSSGRVRVVNDIYTASLSPCHLEFLEGIQVRAKLLVPIVLGKTLWGLMLASDNHAPRLWQSTDVDLLQQLATQVAIAIQQATAYQQAQIELEERQRTEATLRQLAENLQAGIIIHAPDTTIMFANTAATSFLGVTQEDLVGRSVEDFVGHFFRGDGSVMPLDEFPVSLVMRDKQPLHQYELGMYRSSTQEMVWALVNAYPELNEQNRLVQVVVTFVDITTRKQAETALYQLNQDLEARVNQRTDELRQAEERFVFALRSAPVVVFNQDHNLRYTWIYNPALGYAVDEVLGKTDHDLMPPESAQHLMEIKQRVLATGVGERHEISITAEGTTQYFDLTVEPLQSPTQEMVGVACTALNMTAIKQAELELKESQRFVQRITDTSPNVLYIYDLQEQRNIYANRGIAAILGYTSEETQAMGVSLLATVMHPDDLPRIWEYYQQVEAAQEGEIFEIEYRVRHAANHWCWLYSRDTVFARDQEGRVKQILGTAQDITERKSAEGEREAAEAALAASEHHLSTIVNNISDGVLILDYQGQIIFSNPSAERMFGLPPEEQIIGYTLGVPVSLEEPFEMGVIRRSGVLGFGEMQVVKIKWDGRSCYLASLRDITDRKQAEVALQSSEKKFRAMFNSSFQFMVLLTPKGKIIAANDTALDFGDLTLEETIGQVAWQVDWFNFSPITQKQIRQGIFTAAQGTFCRFEVKVRNRDHATIDMDVTFKPLLDEAGNVYQILGEGRDISDRKLAEEALCQQIEREQLMAAIAQRVRQSLNLDTILKTTVEEVQQLLAADRVMVYQIFPDGTGSAIAEGISPGLPRILDIIFPAETFPEECYRAYVGGRVYVLDDREQGGVLPCMIAFMRTFSVRAKLVVPIIQNEVLWGLLIVHQCSAPRHWQLWEINLLQQLATQLAIAIQQSQLYAQLQSELQERQRAEERLRQNNEILATINADLARATRLKDEFLANMSHELRTPLNVVLAMAEGLLDEVYGSLNNEQQNCVAAVDRSGRHLLDLINDILDLAKVESGKLELHPVPTNIKSLCASSLTFVKQQAQQKQITLNIEISPELTSITVDELRMRQVLINLLSNAVKFTPDGGRVTLDVRFQAAAGSGQQPQEVSVPCFWVRFSIIDTGIGIAQQDMDKLFQAFVQIDSNLNRQYAGTGLGLALVKRMVELHDGHITVESQVGQGSRFTVWLPYRSTLPPARKERTNPRQPATQYSKFLSGSPSSYPISPTLTPPLLLLAEDNEANIETLAPYLEARGFQLAIARNGQEAFDIAKTRQPQLILMDIQMPEVDGLTAIKMIRADPTLADIPIIALTALAMTGDRELCLNAGADDYVSKPIPLKELVQLIQTYLL